MTTNRPYDLGAGVPDSGATTGTAATPGTSGATGSDSTAQQAQEKARETAGTAADETRHVAGVAQEEAKQVAAEAQQHLRGLLDEATQQVGEQTSAQKSRLAEQVRTFGDDLQSMQQQGGTSGLAASVLQQVSEQARTLASRLEDKEPQELLDDVRRFARQRPGTFLLGALAAGVVAGRLARGAKAARDGSTTSAGSLGSGSDLRVEPRSVGRTPGAPVPAPVTASAPASDAPVGSDLVAPIPPTDDDTSPAYLSEGGDAGPSYLGTEEPTARPTGPTQSTRGVERP